MDVSIADGLEDFNEDVVRRGRYASASDVVCEGLRLVQEREAKFKALRDTLDASMADPRPSLSDEEVGEHLRQRAATLTGARGDHA